MTAVVTNVQATAQLRRNPLLSRVLSRLPPHIQGSFTPAQIEALDLAASEVSTRHIVALRGAVPGWRKRYYFAFFIGLDRRRKLSHFERMLRAGMRQTATRRLIVGSVLLASLALLLFSLLCGLYVIKSLAGINVFEGHSVLHDFFFPSPRRH